MWEEIVMGKLWTRREKPPAPLRPVPAPASAEPRLLGYVDHDWVSPLAGAYYSWGRCFSAACVEGEEGHHHMESLVPITPEQFAAARAAGWES